MGLASANRRRGDAAVRRSSALGAVPCGAFASMKADGGRAALAAM